ncbi:unnamed protein product [Zymoseptoria tritici ST99CH_3D7]|uniref:Uncharacterized protein n=1 Tax=Zymoseptoria tritici (strain ST99CH_3D7) TaxID=1276538 RepID=A0A1X7RCR8_ZYMT9|nr:unnamed protein product [Zymoseptoria tritici ST99CH_3D7]
MKLKMGVDAGQEGDFFMIGEPWPLHSVFGCLKETEIPVEIVNPGCTAEQKDAMVKWYFGRRSVFLAHDWYALREWIAVVKRLGLLWRIRDVHLIVHLGTADEYVGYGLGRAEADERAAEVKDAVL